MLFPVRLNFYNNWIVHLTDLFEGQEFVKLDDLLKENIILEASYWENKSVIMGDKLFKVFIIRNQWMYTANIET